MDGGTTAIEILENVRILGLRTRRLLPIVHCRRKTHAFKRLPC